MNRREFLAAVLAAAAGAKISELCNSAIPDRDAFTVDMTFESSLECVPRWNASCSASSRPLSIEMLHEARDRIWASRAQPTLYNRRIYERTGLLVPL